MCGKWKRKEHQRNSELIRNKKKDIEDDEDEANLTYTQNRKQQCLRKYPTLKNLATIEYMESTFKMYVLLYNYGMVFFLLSIFVNYILSFGLFGL